MKTTLKQHIKVTITFKDAEELDTLICELGALLADNSMLNALYDQLCNKNFKKS